MKKYLKFKKIDCGIKLCKVNGYSKKQRKKINKICLSKKITLDDINYCFYEGFNPFSLFNRPNILKKNSIKIRYISYKDFKESLSRIKMLKLSYIKIFKRKEEDLAIKKEDVMRIKRERAAKVQEMNKKRHPGFKK